jgi:hypothetical protein
MGRNYFSKHGGPYFINDGFSHHSESLDKNTPDPEHIFIAIGFVIGVIVFSIVMIVL